MARKKIIILLFLLFLLTAACVRLAAITHKNAEEKFENFTEPDSAFHFADEILPPDKNPAKFSCANDFLRANISDISDTGHLLLVNLEHPLIAVPEFDTMAEAWPAVPVKAIDGIRLHPSALEAAAALFEAAAEAEAGMFYVSSGYRSFDEQAELYSGGSNGYALPPGCSEHHTGLAIDIMASGVSQQALGNSPQGKWLEKNAHRFGLILRYPDGARHITGVPYEPWHFRFVGLPHSLFMFENGMVFEEYINFLRQYGRVEIELDGKTFAAVYTEATNGTINVPAGTDFFVSSDNTGNYIVTWLLLNENGK
ncbi:MAG: M15 family metallopeptidase [Defluviitaleaceae bacterium]|nr:M15 family metallopeptidase [Defluviitaleaceae bacterium]